MKKLPGWLKGTTHKDWLRDGARCSEEQWKQLNWSKAYVDLGPSPAGNPGPYWHVPDMDGDCTHRMYPKLLAGKWPSVVRRAMDEHRKKIADLLLIAVDDYESNNGKINPAKMPKHWTVQAQGLLGIPF